MLHNHRAPVEVFCVADSLATSTLLLRHIFDLKKGEYMNYFDPRQRMASHRATDSAAEVRTEESESESESGTQAWLPRSRGGKCSDRRNRSSE